MNKRIPIFIFFLIAVIIIVIFLVKGDEHVKELETFAKEAIKKEDYKSAIPYLIELKEHQPEDLNTSKLLATCLTFNGYNKLMPSALKELNFYLSRNPNNDSIRICKYFVCLKLNKFDSALTEINKLVIKDTLNMNLLYWKANILLLLHQYKAALNIYTKIYKSRHNQFLLYSSYIGIITSKYFDGNFEGAWWDSAFLEFEGFEKNPALVQQISNRTLTFEYVNPVHLLKSPNDVYMILKH